jgi:hypothetical protein
VPASVNRARSSNKRTVPVAEAKSKVISAIRDGVSVRDAMALVDRREATYLDWRKTDKTFAAAVDEVRDVARAARERGTDGKTEVPDFPEFCAEYLDKPLPEHHLRVWDVLNGREPRSMHPAIRHQVGRDNRVLLNFPPYHAKTAVWSVNYCVWRIIKDPNVRIAVVSKTQDLAKKIVAEIKQILTMPAYAKLHAAFMPEGGWRGELDPHGDLPGRHHASAEGPDAAGAGPGLAGVRLAPRRDLARRPGGHGERPRLREAGRQGRHRVRLPRR